MTNKCTVISKIIYDVKLRELHEDDTIVAKHVGVL
jgi:hypothetical protein